MPVCQHCQQPFPRWVVVGGKPRHLSSRRYCLACSPFGGHNTRPLPLRKPKRPCSGCGRLTKNAKYCSCRCQKDSEWRQRKRTIDETGITPPDARAARRYLLETRGRACSICGLTTWRGQPIPLVLDHISGNAGDWRVCNLRLVCGNCDMQLPTFKSKNRGKRRAWRRRRYAEGLSY